MMLAPLTELTEALQGLGWFRDSNPVVIASRTLMMGAWAYCLPRLWRFRHLPHANQALAGATALLLSNTLILFRTAVPYDVLLFFVAMGQLTLAISFTKLFGLLKRMLPEPGPGVGREDGSFVLATVPGEERELSSLFVQSAIGLSVLGVASMFIQYLL